MSKFWQIYLLLITIILNTTNSYRQIHHEVSYSCHKVIKDQQKSSYWTNLHDEDLVTKHDQMSKYWQNIDNYKAKNIILFVGDGMNIDTVTATRIVANKNKPGCGEETKLAMEKLQFSGFAKTYAVDRQTPDSASTATALLTGIKGRFLTISSNEDVDFSIRCSGSSFWCPHSSNINSKDKEGCLKKHSIARKFKKIRGPNAKIGIITTTHFAHATPAPLYSCWASRLHYSEIAMQFESAVKDPPI